MNEEQLKEQQAMAAQTEAQDAQATADVAQTEAQDAEATASEATAPDYGGDFRKEYTGRYPNEDLSGDEAYYNSLRDRLSERDGYEKSFENLSNAVGRSPMFDEMMKAAKEDPNFDPVIWAVENGKLDIQALQSDPEYAKKLTEAQKKSLATKAKQKELEDEGAKNFQPSLDMINRVCEELGVSEDQRNQAIANMYQIMEDLIVNKVDENTFRMILNGMNYEGDVAQARTEGAEEGYAQGLSKKVDDKLRKMPKTSGSVGGRQTARQEAPTQTEEPKSNMFGL